MADMKSFVPYQAPPEPVRQDQYAPVPYSQFPTPFPGSVAVPPPRMLGQGRDLLCTNCEAPIELGSDHLVVTQCVAVPSKKDPSAVVSENHQESKDHPFCDEECLIDYRIKHSLESGDGFIDGLIESYFGGPVLPCRCGNCGEDLDSESVPDLLCQHCESKMR